MPNKELGDAAGMISNYAKEYPELTTAVNGATESIKVMTAAAYAFAGLKLLQGGISGVPGTGGTASTGGKLASGMLSIAAPAIAITAGSVALSSLRDKMREDFDKKAMPEKLQSIQDGSSGYSFVDIAWAVIKSRMGGDERKSSINIPQQPNSIDIAPQPIHGIGDNQRKSSINIPQLPEGGIDILPGLNHDIANFGTPTYLQRNDNNGFLNGEKSDNKQPLVIRNQLILDEKVLAEAVNNFNGEQSLRGSGTPNY